MSTVFGFLWQKSPLVRRALWRLWYEVLAARSRSLDWPFMNYGYVELDGDSPSIPLAPADEPHRSCIQLYHFVATAVDLRGCDVLEVGSGRGGGADYVARYLGPRSVLGIDVSRRAVELCRRRYAARGLSFAWGDAEALPVPDAAADAVINVESSHCYGSMQRFVAEVTRVLRPGGSFLFADLRPAAGVDGLRQDLQRAGLVLTSERIITPNVVAALERDSARKRDLITRRVPSPLHRGFATFAGIPGTRLYNELRGGQLAYFSCVLRKPGARSTDDRIVTDLSAQIR